MKAGLSVSLESGLYAVRPWLRLCAADTVPRKNRRSFSLYSCKRNPFTQRTGCSGHRIEHIAVFSTSPVRTRRFRPNFNNLRRLRSVKETSSEDDNPTDTTRQTVAAGQKWRQNPLRYVAEADARSGVTKVSTIPSDTCWPTSRDRKTAIAQHAVRPGLPQRPTSIGALEEHLRWYTHDDPNPTAARAVLDTMIRQHGVMPTHRHYEALLLSNCSPSGSAKEIQSIWTELSSNNIDVTASILSAALSALAIHPMLGLQREILASSGARWLTTTASAQHKVIVSLIRTDQLELAQILLNDLHSSQKSLPVEDRTPVPLYLYTLFLQHLVIRKDYDAVIRFIYRLRDRNATDIDLPARFWSWLLQHAAKDGDGWVSGWIWQEWVEKMKIWPTRKTCHAVLRISARDRVPWLAQSVRDTVEHGGTSTTRAVRSRHNKLPSKALSASELKLIELSQGADVNTAYAKRSFEADPSSAASNRTFSSRHIIRSGNMWPYFDHSGGRDSGRIDPWNALGPKSRRH